MTARTADRAAVLRLLEGGRAEQARDLLRAWLREAAPDADPYLRRLHVWCVERELGPGHAAAALPDLPPVEASHAAAAECRCLEAALAAGDALEAGRSEALAEKAQAAARTLPERAPYLELVVASVLQAAYRFTARARLADAAVEVATRLGDRSDVPALAVAARSLRGNVRMLQGRYHEANEDFGGALDLARAAARAEDPSVAMALQFRAYVLYEWNRLEEAAGLLEEAARWGEQAGSRGVRSGCYRMLCQVELARNRPREAARWLGRLEALVDGRASLRNREWLQAVQARLAMASGDLRGTEAWVRARGYDADELAAAEPAALLTRLHELTTLMDALLALDRASDAAALAGAVHRATRDVERRWFTVRAGAVEAAALDRAGERDAADATLRAALALGRPHGYVRAYADVGASLLPVVRRVADADPASARLGRILSATEATASWQDPPPVLTRREREVLGLLARGYSNKLIARRLGVSLATVKTHVHHLFGKLRVSSRANAVRRADALALL